MMLGNMPKRITIAMDGSQTSNFGNERKASTFEGDDICVMWSPRANSKPAQNSDAWRAGLSALGFPSVAVTFATRRGNSRQANIVAAVKRTSESVVSREGYLGV